MGNRYAATLRLSMALGELGDLETKRKALLIGNSIRYIMTPAQLRFARFKSGPLGRTIDTMLGLALIWWGCELSSVVKDLAVVIGALALLAGVLNVCWVAPIIGIPFRGKDVPKAGQV